MAGRPMLVVLSGTEDATEWLARFAIIPELIPANRKMIEFSTGV